MTSFTWTSRQARTHRVQWMHASSATRMAGWLASGAGASRTGNRLPVTSRRSAHCHSRDPASWAASRAGWSAISSSSTMPRAFRARSLPVYTFMPVCRTPDARRGQRALSLHFHHAGATVAVRPVARPRVVAQVRDHRPLPLGHLPEGVAGRRLHFPVVEGETHGLAHDSSSLKKRKAQRTELGAAWPRPQMEGVGHGHAEGLEQRLIPRGPLQELHRLLRPHPARSALPAALVLEETHQVPDHGLHVILIAQHHHAMGTDETAVLLQ